MVFKRKYPRPFWTRLAGFVWPKGGWARAASYVSLRLRRLPDSPQRIARGIFAGVFAAFTPFFGFHFIIAGLIAKILRGNILAALLGTFFGNPLTYWPIGLVSLQTGHLLLGRTMDTRTGTSLLQAFIGAGRDLRDNISALFTPRQANWENLASFHHEVFTPYLVGGLLPGLAAGLACYYVSVPIITAYQKRRRRRLRAKLAEIRGKSMKTPDEA